MRNKLTNAGSLLSLAITAALTLPAPHVCAQATTDQTTGVSHPEQLNDTIESTDSSAPATHHYQKPSPAVPMQAAITSPADHYVPPSADAAIPSQTPTLQTHDYAGAPASSATYVEGDPDSGVVTSVPMGPNDLPVGTRLVAQLNNTISTKLTATGTRFAAELIQPVTRDGRVIIPAGSVINGRVTQIHGGRRISGASAIRLTPDEIILPNRASYRLSADVVDLDHYRSSKVNGEGVITANTDNRVDAGATGLTTTTGLVTGAMVGGPIGAGVGAGIGAGVGAYWWLRADHQQTLPTGTEIVFGLDDILSVTPSNASNRAPAPAAD